MKKIPRLIYRKDNNVTFSDSTESSYLDLNTTIPDYCDYFDAAEKYRIKKESICIPSENGRGCRWNKCKFCFLNTAYKYREKNIEHLVTEIKNFAGKFNVYSFNFTGSDLVGHNSKNFESLLDALIKLNNESENEFTFGAEIIPKNISAKTIQKMALANFIVQIGYEAVSDSLLKKMNKLTRFADLIFFIKFAHKYGVFIKTANIITKIPNETKADIMEAAYNLPFLRFFLGEQGFEHNHSSLKIKKGTEFFKSIEDEKKYLWSHNPLYSLLPEKLTAKIKDRFSLFYFFSERSPNSTEWEIFKNIDQCYTKDRFYYKITFCENLLYYREYCNNEFVKSICFDEPEYIDILKETNNQIISLDMLHRQLSHKYPNITKKYLVDCLKTLKEEYLIYFNSKMTQIISIIDLESPIASNNI